MGYRSRVFSRTRTVDDTCCACDGIFFQARDEAHSAQPPRVLEPRTGWQGLRSPAPPKGAVQCPQPTQSRHMRRRRVKRRVPLTARAAPDRGYRVLSGARATHASFFFFFIPLCVRFSVCRNGQGKNANFCTSKTKTFVIFPIQKSYLFLEFFY